MTREQFDATEEIINEMTAGCKEDAIEMAEQFLYENAEFEDAIVEITGAIDTVKYVADLIYFDCFTER